MKENELLRKCLLQIEKKLNWGSYLSWTNNEYSKLSNLILERTEISISVSSLRRLFSKTQNPESTYKPQMETRNALAIFLGYSNWANFTKKNKEKSEQSNIFFARSVLWKYVIVPGCLVILFAGIGFRYIAQNIKPEHIQFEARNLVSDKIPHTITIDYNLADYRGPFYIDWGEYPTDGSDPPEPDLLDGTSGKTSHTYFTKSTFDISLLDRRRNVVKTIQTYIKTEGWDCFVEQEGIKIEIDSTNFKKAGYLAADVSMFHKQGIDSIRPYRLYYRNFKKFGVEGENLQFRTRFKPFFRKGYIECSHVQIELIGESGRFLITLMAEGCAGSNKSVIVGRDRYDGIHSDLGGLVVESDKWQELMLLSRNKELILYLNKREVFKMSYDDVVGKIIGLRYEFKGNGIVESYVFDRHKNMVF